MSLVLRASHLDEIQAHLARAYPDEGCGVMLGRDDGPRRLVERVVGLENRRADSRHNRYLIAPEELLVTERDARVAGLDVLGFYHSHPDHPARPSAFDLEHAWPYYSYLIVSMEQGRAGEVRAWRLVEDRSRFEPEAIDGDPAPAAERARGPGAERAR